MSNRRVVVTGMGIMACNGSSVSEFEESIFNGRHGIRPIEYYDTTDHQTLFGGEVRFSNNELAGGDKRLESRKDRYVLLALKAAEEAMQNAGLVGAEWDDPCRVGCVVGSGVGGLATAEQESRKLHERGPRRVSPLLIPKMIVDSAAGDVSISYNAKGPNYSISTACATGSHCIGASFNHIRTGLCDVMIAGGSEAPITGLGISGFNNIKALSKRNDSPGTASRPFDAERDGFVIAEGAGILILEELEHAKKRGATIYGEVVGYGCTGDAHHETQPDPEGYSGQACMRLALQDAGINPEQMDYINAHGTSTKYNDKTETMIIKKVFGDRAYKLAVNSTKSMTGHTLGAAGGVEAIATLLSLGKGVLHPTINYSTPDPECDLDYVPNESREQDITYALSNNLGFGGHNASVIFKRFTD